MQKEEKKTTTEVGNYTPQVKSEGIKLVVTARKLIKAELGVGAVAWMPTGIKEEEVGR